jgi:hypothetical protein
MPLLHPLFMRFVQVGICNATAAALTLCLSGQAAASVTAADEIAAACSDYVKTPAGEQVLWSGLYFRSVEDFIARSCASCAVL